MSPALEWKEQSDRDNSVAVWKREMSTYFLRKTKQTTVESQGLVGNFLLVR